MIAQELSKRPHHYAFLIIGEALLLSVFLFVSAPMARMLSALLCGVFYFVWGMWTHFHEIKTTRLMLEYAVVGLLAAVMLLTVVSNI